MVLDAEYEKKIVFFTKKISKMAKMWLKKSFFQKDQLKLPAKITKNG